MRNGHSHSVVCSLGACGCTERTLGCSRSMRILDFQSSATAQLFLVSAYHLSTNKGVYMCTVRIDLILGHFIVACCWRVATCIAWLYGMLKLYTILAEILSRVPDTEAVPSYCVKCIAGHIQWLRLSGDNLQIYRVISQL